MAELHSVHIYTVEALASLSDGNVHHVIHGRELREKAQKWLKTKTATDLADQNAKLLARIDALERSRPGRREPRLPPRWPGMPPFRDGS